MDKPISALAIAGFAAALTGACVAEDAVAPTAEPVMERAAADDATGQPTYQPPVAPGNRTPRAQGDLDTTGLLPEQIDAVVAMAFA